jgi:hypothetical protein
MIDYDKVVNDAFGKPINSDKVSAENDINILEDIAESVNRISHLFRQLVAPFLSPDVLLADKQIVISSKDQERNYRGLLHELEVLDALIVGANRDLSDKPLPKKVQRIIDMLSISFNTVEKYKTFASESYQESKKTTGEMLLHEQSVDVALNYRSKLKCLLDLFTQHKKIYETDVSKLLNIYEGWNVE